MDMQIVAEFISRRETVAGVSIILILWAFISGFSLLQGANRLIRALDDASGLIGGMGNATDFAVNYESISARIATSPILGGRWREYIESLVLPQDSNRPIRATMRAGGWFDPSLLRVPAIGVDARYHAALPN